MIALFNFKLQSRVGFKLCFILSLSLIVIALQGVGKWLQMFLSWHVHKTTPRAGREDIFQMLLLRENFSQKLPANLPSPLNGTSPFLNQSLFSVAPVDPEPDKRVRITASKDVRDKVTCQGQGNKDVRDVRETAPMSSVSSSSH